MEEIIINGKALYTPKGAAREYAAVGCNFYTGCPHNCDYCYLKRGAPSKQLGGTEVQLKKCFKDDINALMKFQNECEKYIDHLRTVGIFFSFTTDPMLKETCMLTIKAALLAIELGIPVMVLTKCADVPLSVNLLINGIPKEKRHLIAFGFTLTGRDDMEPGASRNCDRIDAMRRLKDLGFITWASIEPIIDFDSSLRVIKDSLRFCNHYKIGLRSGVKKDYYNDEDLRQFIWNVNKAFTDAENDYMANPSVYWKESVRKRMDCGLIHSEFNRFAVEIGFTPFMRP